jgi:hypothetical protein
MKRVIVRYKVKEDKAQQNIEFIQNENGSKRVKSVVVSLVA